MNKESMHIKTILQKIKYNNLQPEDNAYYMDKQCILDVFNSTIGTTFKGIKTRLTLIDSFYSTQMTKRYYGLDDLANAMFQLYSKKQQPLSELFKKFLETKDITLFNYDDNKNLFSSNYGIDKNGKEKGVAISLISKYAYFDTNLNFPIYDTIVCEMYPKIWKYCDFDNPMPKLSISKGRVLGDKTIVSFVKAIDELISKFGNDVSYDELDQLLWHTGKVCRGNLSLILSKVQYLTTINNYNINQSLNNLKFLKKDTLLYYYFELAQQLNKI